MAGRGRAAVLPAWMKAAGATPAAPGSSAAPRSTAPAASLAAAAKPTAAPASAPPVQSAWSEHTAPDGRKYYYNAKTKESSWTKPAELQTPEEKKPVAPAPVAAPVSDWGEFTAPDGRKYYYNKVTKESRWEMPAEMRPQSAPAVAAAVPVTKPTTVARARSPSPAVAAAVAARPASAAAKPAPEGFVPRAGSLQPGATPHYATTAEAKDAFKGLLLDTGVRSGDSWAEVSSALAGDRRFGALRTLGERKAAFNEYIQQRRREEEDAVRLARLRAKEAFYELLEGAAADLAPDGGTSPSFERARELLHGDARWVAAGTAREQQDLFADWAEERRRVERDRARQGQKRAMAAFGETLRAARWLGGDVSWRKACDRLEGEATYDALDPAARLEVFKEVMGEVEAREREAREREREERGRAERGNRAAFRELLAAKRDEGLIHARSRWREVLPALQEDPLYLAVERNASGARPRELFEDLLMDLEDAYDRDRAVLKRVTKARELVVSVDTTYDQFTDALFGVASGGEKEQSAGGGEAVEEAGVLPEAVGDEDKAPEKGPETAPNEDKAPEAATEKADADAASGEPDHEMGDAEAKTSAVRAASEVSVPALDEEDAAALKAITAATLHLFYEELIGKAKDEEAQRAKEARYRREDFTRLLKHDRQITTETTWEEVVPMIDGEPEWKDLENEEEKKELFEAFIAKLKAKEVERQERRKSRDGSESSDDDTRERRRHKHRKDKKRRHGDSDEDGGRKHKRRSGRSRSGNRRRSSERHNSRRRSASRD